MKKSINIIRISGLCFLIIILSSGCSLDYSSKKNIYCNPEVIAADGDSYSFTERIESCTDECLSISFSGFYGKETIFQIEGKEGRFLNLTADCSLIRGDFKLCLVDPGKNVTTILEGCSEKNMSFALREGEYKIVIVGINAIGNIKLSWELKNEI